MTAPASDPLPTEGQRKLLCEMIATAFIEMRLLGWAGKAEQVADLADAFHNVPREMYGWGGWDHHRFRAMLHNYRDKYPDGWNYVAMLDAIFQPLD